VLEATDLEEGLLAERLGCYGESREILRVHGMGAAYAHQNRIIGKTEWQFEGQEIFKKAVHGMSMACAEALAKIGKGPDDVDLVVPHQANMRIIEAVAKKAGVPMERVFTNVHRYGNMSAATVPVALCEALVNGGIMPYYLHLLDPVAGSSHFNVPEERGIELIRYVQHRLSGYGVPRLVREVPGKASKTFVI